MTGAAAAAAYRQRRQTADPVAWQREQSEHQALFRHRHPEKKSAWNKVYKAIKRGELVRPNTCERCGIECRPEASHDDYTKPLDVEWLCKKCHSIKDFSSERNRD